MLKEDQNKLKMLVLEKSIKSKCFLKICELILWFKPLCLMSYRQMIPTKVKSLDFVKMGSNRFGMEMCYLLMWEVFQEELSKSIKYLCG